MLIFKFTNNQFTFAFVHLVNYYDDHEHFYRGTNLKFHVCITRVCITPGTILKFEAFLVGSFDL